ncbi:unnamed protein product [[Candida] boidinii]|nr:unnamed protein product [[Candida] boidinii]
MNQQQISTLFEKAKEIVEQENKLYYEEFSKSSSQKSFLSNVLTNGTLSDKVSALTLLVQEAPLHNLKSLDQLFSMCEKKSRTAALQCITAVVDLLVNGLLPGDRKLRYFNKQPLTSTLSNKQLAIFYFEDYLKKLYFKFIGILEKLSHDSIVHVRTKIVGFLFELLRSKPEQEANLLRLGVNKIGDTDSKVSSKTSYQILLLEQQHPAMKKIVVEAVVDILFRRNNDYHSTYYSIITLNQTILTKREEDLANKLVDVYFALFEKLLIQTDKDNTTTLKETKTNISNGRRKRNMKKGKNGGVSVKEEREEKEILDEKNSKLFAGILTGLNRAFPFSNLPSSVFDSHLNTLYKITHSTNFNTSVQALLLIYNITVQHSTVAANRDRFYKTLYESLLDPRLLTSSKQGIYLNLLFKSVKNDTEKERVLAFVKRIVQISLGWLNIGTISGLLYLLIELEKSAPYIRNLFINTPMDDILNKENDSDSENEDETEKSETEATKEGDSFIMGNFTIFKSLPSNCCLIQ